MDKIVITIEIKEFYEDRREAPDDTLVEDLFDTVRQHYAKGAVSINQSVVNDA